jgi:hypothetical protein
MPTPAQKKLLRNCLYAILVAVLCLISIFIVLTIHYGLNHGMKVLTYRIISTDEKGVKTVIKCPKSGLLTILSFHNGKFGIRKEIKPNMEIVANIDYHLYLNPPMPDEHIILLVTEYPITSSSLENVNIEYNRYTLKTSERLEFAVYITLCNSGHKWIYINRIDDFKKQQHLP